MCMLLLTAGTLWLMPFAEAGPAMGRTDPISPENAARITKGMTEAEVEAVLGGRKAGTTFGGTSWNLCIWHGDSGHIAVLFDLRPSGRARALAPADFTADACPNLP